MTVSKVPEAPESRPLPLEKAQICESSPWPGAGRKSGKLFEDRNWLLPPNYLNDDCKNTVSPKSPIKEEPKTGDQSTSPNVGKCQWGPSCSFCKKQEKEIGMANTKAKFRRFHPPPEVQRPQARHPQSLNYQKLQGIQKSAQETQLEKYPSQTKTCKLWEAKMEKLNSKYNLDCFSDSGLDSESDEGEQYQYEHEYETLI